MHHAKQTIFALSSAPGRAGIAVVRISGPQVQAALSALVGELPSPRSATLRPIRHPETAELLDSAIVLFFPAPQSFTGEDVGELHIHGGRAVIDGVLGGLTLLAGLRPAMAGEFARRAFENGKLDLTRVEALADLIDAETEAQRRQAIDQLGGRLQRIYEDWRHRLVEIQALVEASLDFSDEADVAEQIFENASEAIRDVAGEISEHLGDGRYGEILRSGFRVVLAGPPNVGKSSLLNALAGRAAAIVSSEAGTTRDVIEVHLNLGGYPIIVTDTAGMRDGGTEIEQEGIRRAVGRMRDAQLVIWLSDASEATSEIPPKLQHMCEQQVTIRNKLDLLPKMDREDLSHELMSISALTGEGVNQLVEVIARFAKDKLQQGGAEPSPTSARQRAHLVNCQAALERYLAGHHLYPELRAEELREAASAVGRITGRIDVEEVLDKIFAGFCIGK